MTGRVDQFSKGVLTGWAWAPDFPTRRLSLSILVDRNEIARVTADLFRNDLLEQGVGDGRHGFVTYLPTYFADGVAHDLDVCELKTGTLLPALSGTAVWPPPPRTRSQRTTIHCFGDSETTLYEGLGDYFLHLDFHVARIPGATALGMVNPNSRTNALGIIQERLRFIPLDAFVLFNLGVVDTSLVIWWQRQELGLPISTQFEKSLLNYTSFILQAREQGRRNILVSNLTLEILKDEYRKGVTNNHRKDIQATCYQMHDLARKYNARLRVFCRDNDLIFIDFEEDSWDVQNLEVKAACRPHDPYDFHLAPLGVQQLLVPIFHDLTRRGKLPAF